MKMKSLLDVVIHTFNLGTWVAETGGCLGVRGLRSEFQVQDSQDYIDPISKNLNQSINKKRTKERKRSLGFQIGSPGLIS